jgi:uncharacterized protein (DUF1778 family)
MSMDITQGKRDRISLRAARRQVELIDQAAAAVEKNRTDFMLEAAMQESRRVLADRRVFVLGNQERDTFLSLLERPPLEKRQLRALFERGGVLGKE